MSFSKNLLRWYDLNKRELPWRETKDPYVIWISINQKIPYFPCTLVIEP